MIRLRLLSVFAIIVITALVYRYSNLFSNDKAGVFVTLIALLITNVVEKIFDHIEKHKKDTSITFERKFFHKISSEISEIELNIFPDIDSNLRIGSEGNELTNIIDSFFKEIFNKLNSISKVVTAMEQVYSSDFSISGQKIEQHIEKILQSDSSSWKNKCKAAEIKQLSGFIDTINECVSEKLPLILSSTKNDKNTSSRKFKELSTELIEAFRTISKILNYLSKKYNCA